MNIKKDKYSQEMIDKKGIHHFYTYANLLELLNYVKTIIQFELLYINRRII